MHEREQVKKPISRVLQQPEGRRTQQFQVKDNRGSYVLQGKNASFMRTRPVLQRYVVAYNYLVGHAQAQIQNPVGVAPAGTRLMPACHLVAHRFGGAPGGANIVYMPAAANNAMVGDESRVFFYMLKHPNCTIDYDVQTVGYNPLNNTATGANVTASDISLTPPVQVV